MPTLPKIESGASLAALVVASLDRRTHWELVARVPLNFPTHHPQGVAFAGDYIFLSSVQVLEDPLPLPESGQRALGRGVGHVPQARCPLQLRRQGIGQAGQHRTVGALDAERHRLGGAVHCLDVHPRDHARH